MCSMYSVFFGLLHACIMRALQSPLAGGNRECLFLIGVVSNMLKEKLQDYVRVLKIMKKPDREEFFAAAKVTGAGTLIIGLLGYITYLIMSAISAL